MPNDTPDYQPGAPYIAVVLPQTVVAFNGVNFLTLNTAAFTSLLIRALPGASGLTVTATWQDPSGTNIGTTSFDLPSVPAFLWKIPVLGPSMTLSVTVGSGRITVYGGQEFLPSAVMLGAGGRVSDNSYPWNMSYVGPSTAGTPVVLGTSQQSGRQWFSWSFTNTITGYLLWAPEVAGGVGPNVFVATSAEAVLLQSTTTSKLAGFIDLPACPIQWSWVPAVSNAGNVACNLTLVGG